MLRKMLAFYGYEHLADVMEDYDLTAVDAVRWLTEKYIMDAAVAA